MGFSPVLSKLKKIAVTKKELKICTSSCSMRDIFSADNRVTRPVGFVTTSEFRALVRLVVAFCLVRREGLTKGLITAASFLKPAI